ncbi:hypothetical protein IFN73_10135 [Francisella tularensis subsp. holarctica]|nr:hypothetical protein [Francisella tularensis subsp. holarctica]
MLLRGATHEFDELALLDVNLTPLFFGTALCNFVCKEMMYVFTMYAPAH